MRVGTRVGLTFSIALLVLATTGVLSYRQTTRLIESTTLVSHTHEVLESLEASRALVLQSESAVRGFILTGEQRFLFLYEQSSYSLKNHLARLGTLTSDSPEQQERLKTLEAHIANRIIALERAIDARREVGLEAAADIIRNDDGYTLARQVERIIIDGTKEESALLATRAQKANTSKRAALLTDVLGIGVAFVLLATGALALTRSLTRPIQSLLAGAERIREGDFSQSVVLGSKDELAVLAEAFNKMSEARRETEAALRHAKDTAEAASGELEAFSYSVSHDLRAPLRSIDGFGLALLEDCGDALDESGKSHLRRIRNATTRMGQLIDDLLKLSRITRAELRCTQVDISALALSIAAELEGREPRGVHCRIAPGLRALGDAALLRIALENLLANAWKFTAKTAHPRVEVDSVEKNGATVLYVKDNGAGFEMAHVERLFRAFQRLHSLHEFEGTGIGLAIVQRIVSRHNGRIWAESALGAGATFYFTLGVNT